MLLDLAGSHPVQFLDRYIAFVKMSMPRLVRAAAIPKRSREDAPAAPSGMLAGVTVGVRGPLRQPYKSITQMVTTHGGVCGEWPNVNVLVSSIEGAQGVLPEEGRGIVVSEDWLEACVAAGKVLLGPDADAFRLKSNAARKRGHDDTTTMTKSTKKFVTVKEFCEDVKIEVGVLMKILVITDSTGAPLIPHKKIGPTDSILLMDPQTLEAIHKNFPAVPVTHALLSACDFEGIEPYAIGGVLHVAASVVLPSMTDVVGNDMDLAKALGVPVDVIARMGPGYGESGRLYTRGDVTVARNALGKIVVALEVAAGVVEGMDADGFREMVGERVSIFSFEGKEVMLSSEWDKFME